MKIKHEHIESVLLALAAEKGQAWVANAITEEYLRQGGGELPLVPGKDWNNQQNIYHRWLKGETNAQREKIQKLIPAVLAILPRELRHRLRRCSDRLTLSRFRTVRSRQASGGN